MKLLPKVVPGTPAFSAVRTEEPLQSIELNFDSRNKAAG